MYVRVVLCFYSTFHLLQGTYEGLVRQGLTAYRDCPSGANSITLSVMPAMLAAYHPVSAAPSSYLTTFQLNTTLQALKQASSLLTDATYGLLPVDPRCLYPFSKGPERADVSLNAWATWLVEQLSSAPASSGTVGFTTDKGLAADWGALRTATKTWRKALELQLVADAVAARSAQPPRAFQDLDTLSWARLVLGSGWNPSGVGADVQKDLSMDRMVAAAVNMSVGAQARVGLTLLSSSSSSSEVGKITNRLLSNTRVGGRTAYVATGDGQRGAAGEDRVRLGVLYMGSCGAVASRCGRKQTCCGHDDACSSRTGKELSCVSAHFAARHVLHAWLEWLCHAQSPKNSCHINWFGVSLLFLSALQPSPTSQWRCSCSCAPRRTTRSSRRLQPGLDRVQRHRPSGHSVQSASAATPGSLHCVVRHWPHMTSPHPVRLPM